MRMMVVMMSGTNHGLTIAAAGNCVKSIFLLGRISKSDANSQAFYESRSRALSQLQFNLLPSHIQLGNPKLSNLSGQDRFRLGLTTGGALPARLQHRTERR